MGERIGRAASWLLLLVLLAAACAAVDERGQDQSGTGGPAEADDFCRNAESFITDDSVTDIASFGPEFFADVDRRLTELIETSPPEVVGDLQDLREGFRTSDQVLTRFDHDASDPALIPALDEIDQSAMLLATENIEAYLSRQCDGFGQSATDRSGNGSVAVNDAEVEDIMEAFSVDRPVAECLNRELGDIAKIDPAELTQELLSAPVCGTTLIGLLTGTG